MSEYLTDREGKLMVDFAGKVENLPLDFEVIVEKAGTGVAPALPRVMVGHYDHDYRASYTPETRDLVAERFREDIARFDYQY